MELELESMIDDGNSTLFLICSLTVYLRVALYNLKFVEIGYLQENFSPQQVTENN